MRKFNVAVVGATGLVGRTFIDVLKEYNFPVAKFLALASNRSAGKKINAFGKEFTVQELNENSFKEIDLAFFSAGGEVSKKFVPIAVNNGAKVFDNSSVFRMDSGVPLIVPEVNLQSYNGEKVIANPNCSTIQSVIPLYALMRKFGIKRVNYTTYQAVSGSGQKGINDLNRTLNGDSQGFYLHSIARTCIPEIDKFLQDGYTAEEKKMIDETRKILSVKDLPISATCVRVPVENCHAVSILVELEKPFDERSVRECLEKQEGVIVLDNPSERVYPVSTCAHGRDEVFVGRLRRDYSAKNGLILYCVADNLRKGAASNAIQTALRLINMGLIK